MNENVLLLVACVGALALGIVTGAARAQKPDWGTGSPAPSTPTWGTQPPSPTAPPVVVRPSSASKNHPDVAPDKPLPKVAAGAIRNPLLPKAIDAAPLILIGLKQAPLTISAPALNLVGLRPSPVSISAAQLNLVGLRAAPLTIAAPELLLVGLGTVSKASLQPKASPGGTSP